MTLEDSHSGLVHHLGKVATGQLVRGFKSLILRSLKRSEKLRRKGVLGALREGFERLFIECEDIVPNNHEKYLPM